MKLLHLLDREPQERRWKRLAVTPGFLVDLAKITEWVTVRTEHNPLPDDARVVSISYDAPTDMLYLILESASYEPLEEGYQIPIVNPPTWARWYGKPGEAPA